VKALRLLLGVAAVAALVCSSLVLGFLLLGELAQLVHWMIKS
jgi:hypothetical protein